MTTLYALAKTAMPGFLVENKKHDIKPFALSTENLKFFGMNNYMGVVARQPTHFRHYLMNQDGWTFANQEITPKFVSAVRVKPSEEPVAV